MKFLSKLYRQTSDLFIWLKNHVPAFVTSDGFLRFCIALIFLKTIWAIWVYKDMTYGDTSSYFQNARGFANDGSNNFAWSPTYTSYFGMLYYFTRDAYTTVIFHRVFEIAAIVFLMFELCRRLLSPVIAFLLVAWWLLLPINHNSLYEVHLFAFIPLLLCLYLSTVVEGYWGRAITLACLALTTILVRNEYAIASVLFGLACLVIDFILPCWRNFREEGWNVLKTLAIYVTMGVVTFLIAFSFYDRSLYKYPALKPVMHAKHALNMAQILTYTHQQRTGDTSFSPWTEYQDYMKKTYGNDLPTLSEAFMANPGAVIQHFTWNLGLAPNGFQVALFNVRAGDDEPDYIPTPKSPTLAYSLSAAFFVLLAAGAFCYYTLKEKTSLFAVHPWTWYTVLCMALTGCFVIMMQRPRPSYMFMLTFSLMLLAGVALYYIIRRFQLEKSVTTYFPCVAVIIVFIFPWYWVNRGVNEHRRPLLAHVHALELAGIPNLPDQRVILLEYAFESTAYAWGAGVGQPLGPYVQKATDFASLNAALDKDKFRYVVINDEQLKQNVLKLPGAGAGPIPQGWKLLAQVDDHDAKTFVLDRLPDMPPNIPTYRQVTQ
ncbi:hypothetical protein DB346_09020 [Verrucomicrobia bacterium LW23]|nr:hypothetical protein DB346_09020 [Verrucomicrobia bacterium LW23]